MQGKKIKEMFSKINVNTKQLVFICIIIFSFFSILKPTRFPTFRNFESMCFQFPEPGLFTLGIAITMLTAGADLSIVAVANLVATICGMLLLNVMPNDAGTAVQFGFVSLCFLVAIFVGLLCGCLNGFLIAKLGIFPILATLGTQNLYTGISSVLTKGQGVFGVFPDSLIFIGSGKLFGFLPMPFLLFLLVLIIVTILIHYTPYGLKTQWFGSNRRASYYCGIDNVRTVFTTYLMASLIGALTGILILARTNSAKYDYGTTYVLQAMLASVLAGVSPLGGKGYIPNIFLSVLALQMLDSGFNFLRITSFVRSSTYGILLIVSIAIEYVRESLKRLRNIKSLEQKNQKL
ncbi:MAG: ABC transporter permease [Christensenellaceae bacterium]|nr:ABC transporter permease [Christensenellaceae bacterium]